MTLKNTEANAVFSIKNAQKFDEDDELLEVTTEGHFYMKNGSYFLLYDEYTEIGEISVMIKVSGDSVVIRRKGACSAKMEYRKGYKQEVLYSIPFGDMLIDLETESVSHQLNAGGGSLELVYKLTINQETILNHMTLYVTMI